MSMESPIRFRDPGERWARAVQEHVERPPEEEEQLDEKENGGDPPPETAPLRERDDLNDDGEATDGP